MASVWFLLIQNLHLSRSQFVQPEPSAIHMHVSTPGVHRWGLCCFSSNEALCGREETGWEGTSVLRGAPVISLHLPNKSLTSILLEKHTFCEGKKWKTCSCCISGTKIERTGQSILYLWRKAGIFSSRYNNFFNSLQLYLVISTLTQRTDSYSYF